MVTPPCTYTKSTNLSKNFMAVFWLQQMDMTVIC